MRISKMSIVNKSFFKEINNNKKKILRNKIKCKKILRNKRKCKKIFKYKRTYKKILRKKGKMKSVWAQTGKVTNKNNNWGIILWNKSYKNKNKY